ncbi:MAG: hypothetical protein ACOCUY_02620, partial [Verrucomicrobiota bacterium]
MDSWPHEEKPDCVRVTLFGALRYRVTGDRFDRSCELRRRGQNVTLSLDNLAGLEAADIANCSSTSLPPSNRPLSAASPTIPAPV